MIYFLLLQVPTFTQTLKVIPHKSFCSNLSSHIYESFTLPVHSKILPLLNSVQQRKYAGSNVTIIFILALPSFKFKLTFLSRRHFSLTRNPRISEQGFHFLNALKVSWSFMTLETICRATSLADDESADFETSGVQQRAFSVRRLRLDFLYCNEI